MRQINVAMDLYNILVCLILISSQWIHGKRKERQNHYFLLMCVFNTAMTLGDITNWTCEGFSKPWLPLALRLGTVLYYGCSAPLLLSFIGYVDACLPSKAGSPAPLRIHAPQAAWQSEPVCGQVPPASKSGDPEPHALRSGALRQASRGKVFVLAGILTATQLFFSVLSLWTGTFFEITPDNLYQRGHSFYLSQLIPILIYGIIVCQILHHRKRLRLKTTIFLLSNVILPLAAELIQIMNYGLALLNTGNTLALLLIYINIQSERELLIQKQENQLSETRMDMLLNQIYPHFLYNMLSVIRHLCTTDPEEAKEAVQDLSLFLRANMTSLMDKTPIPFEQELSHVRCYLNLEQRRYGPRLQVVYHITAQDFYIPPLTLQPIVENAVRHGITKCESGGAITIQTTETPDTHYITITDTGPGFVPAPSSSPTHHIGLSNVQNRLALLCNGCLDIRPAPTGGTSVTIALPRIPLPPPRPEAPATGRGRKKCPRF